MSVFIFVEDRDALMSCTQDVYFYLGKNNLRYRVWMSHPSHVLRLEIQLYPERLRSERGSSCFKGSEDCSGLNMAWMTNKAKFLARST